MVEQVDVGLTNPFVFLVGMWRKTDDITVIATPIEANDKNVRNHAK